MNRWRWVRADVALAIHDMQLKEHGGMAGIADLGRLEAALARPQNLFAYGAPDAAELAASYAHGIARNHPFNDGNKRTAWVVARLFLARNRVTLLYEPEEAVRMMEALAAGDLSESAAAKWFRERL